MIARRREFTRPVDFEPVAVVDIGSNSVRLVVYDGLRRAPYPVFNEKVLCGLGKGIAINGELWDEGVERAIRALKRFRTLCDQLKARIILPVATAAAREAANGPAFITQAEAALGCKIPVLTGKQEARYAALGVISGIMDANGIIGDLGGGSLELVDIRNGKIRDGVTLPLGPLKILDICGPSLEDARAYIDKLLDKAALLEGARGREFYAVGGAWRNLARLHMAQINHPLNVLHQYTMPRETARQMADLVAGLSPESLRGITAVSRNRAETLPYGALVLERLLARTEVTSMVISALGLREGLAFSQLSQRKRDADPLLSTCWDFTCRYARSPQHEIELCEWTDQFFGNERLPETAGQRRLRHAACLLADIGWRAHPDFRGMRSLNVISQAAVVGVDHPGKAFLALTIFYRYQGIGAAAPEGLDRLVDDEMMDRARLIASLFRLAYLLSAAMPGPLKKIKITLNGARKVALKLPKKLHDLSGEAVDKRFQQLCDQLNATGKIEKI